ncbi:hypothetical protein [Heyndrickxia oleronia]|uniref:hypothetical protein n=1 Tax=Heyndrickxia oleronia TaxID=38875 RepID=UPI00242AE768|nr:hypothetical protein [Heyndrickxia oleronia]MCI1763636.1 hypothetical protein [Heyndrickxia oleronia]
MSKNMKNLSLNQIKKQNTQKFKDKKRVQFDNAKLDIDLVFRPSKKNQLFTEFMEVVVEGLQNKKVFDTEVILALSVMLAIKHFTSIETNAEGYDGLLEMMSILDDGEYTKKILEEFNKTELENLLLELRQIVSKVAIEAKKLAEEENLDKLSINSETEVIH